MNKILKKGQAWSMDLTIGVIIFILVVSLFFVMYSKTSTNGMTKLKLSSETIATKLVENEKIGMINNKIIDEDELQTRLLDINGYEDLKNELGIEKNFCIFLEDENGNLVNITFFNGTDYYSYTGIGSNDRTFNLSGSPCGRGTKTDMR